MKLPQARSHRKHFGKTPASRKSQTCYAGFSRPSGYFRDGRGRLLDVSCSSAKPTKVMWPIWEWVKLPFVSLASHRRNPRSSQFYCWRHSALAVYILQIILAFARVSNPTSHHLRSSRKHAVRRSAHADQLRTLTSLRPRRRRENEQSYPNLVRLINM